MALASKEQALALSTSLVVCKKITPRPFIFEFVEWTDSTLDITLTNSNIKGLGVIFCKEYQEDNATLLMRQKAASPNQCRYFTLRIRQSTNCKVQSQLTTAIRPNRPNLAGRFQSQAKDISV